MQISLLVCCKVLLVRFTSKAGCSQLWPATWANVNAVEKQECKRPSDWSPTWSTTLDHNCLISLELIALPREDGPCLSWLSHNESLNGYHDSKISSKTKTEWIDKNVSEYRPCWPWSGLRSDDTPNNTWHPRLWLRVSSESVAESGRSRRLSHYSWYQLIALKIKTQRKMKQRKRSYQTR